MFMFVYDSDNGIQGMKDVDLFCRVGDGLDVMVEANPSIARPVALCDEEGDGCWHASVPGEMLTIESVKAVLAEINQCSVGEISIEIPDWAKTKA